MSTATHPVAPEEIMAMLDGELTAAQIQSISTHAETCNQCHGIADSLRATSQSLNAWSVPSFHTSAGFESTLARIKSEASGRTFHHQFSIRALTQQHRLGMALASAVILFGLLIYVGTLPRYKLAAPAVMRDRPVDLARTDNARALPEEGRDSFYMRRIPFGKLQAETKPAGPVASPMGGISGVDKNSSSPMIARAVSLSIIAKDFSAARMSLDAVLARHRGYAAVLTANTQENSARSLQASLRVPAPELNATVSELKSLGRVETESQGGEEVTQQHADLLARLKNSRETEQRLQDVLRTRTGKVKDVLEVEQEIARVRGEIEQMEAEQKALEHRVEFASIDLRLTEEYKAQLTSPSPSTSTRFHNAFVTGYKDAVETVVSILLFFAEYGPAIVVWLLLAFPFGWLFWRRWRRNYLVSSSAGAQ
jgi:Domain of unknown function (DUF4349)